MFYTIYKITNKLDGKFYIGMHQTENLDDGYMGSGKLIKRAIAKHSLENFHKEILFIFDNENDMKNKEKELVVISEDSYNLCPGGHGGFGYLNSNGLNKSDKQKEVAKKLAPQISCLGGKASQKILRDKKIGIYDRSKNGFKNKSHTDEWKARQSIIMKEKSKGQNNSQYGTCWITNGQENKKIKKEEISAWISLGYYKGRI